MDFKEQKALVDKDKFLRLYLKTGNATRAAQEVYNCPTRAAASVKGYRLLKELEMGQMMEESGITDRSLQVKFKQGLKAKKYIAPTSYTDRKKIRKNGYVTVPDYAVRKQFLELVLKMKGRENEGTNIQINNFVPLLKGKTKDDKGIVQEGEVVGETNGSIHRNSSHPEAIETTQED